MMHTMHTCVLPPVFAAEEVLLAAVNRLNPQMDTDFSSKPETGSLWLTDNQIKKYKKEEKVFFRNKIYF